MDQVRVGIVGAGGIVRSRHLPGLREIEGVAITAVANSTLDSTQAFIRSNAPEAEAFEHWEGVTSSPDVDVVWIGTPPILHSPVTLAALMENKHVFCQARMAMSHQEAMMMLTTARGRPHLVTALCPPPHGMRGDLYMKKLLEEEVVGPLRMIKLRSLSGTFLDPAKPAHWRQRRELSGANILTLGIHTEVLQRWLGDFRVTGAEGKTFVENRDGYRVRIPDLVNVIARFDNGSLGSFEFSGVYPGDPIDCVDIIGTRGILRYDFSDDTITLERNSHAIAEVLEIPEELERSWTVERDFIEAVRNPKAPRPRPNFEDGVAYMEVVQTVSDLVAHQS